MHIRLYPTNPLCHKSSSNEKLHPRPQVRRWIKEGLHWNAADEVYISWGRRLLHCPGLLQLKSQVLILRLLADYPEDQIDKLKSVVDMMGGVKELFLRFFRHHAVGCD